MRKGKKYYLKPDTVRGQQFGADIEELVKAVSDCPNCRKLVTSAAVDLVTLQRIVASRLPDPNENSCWGNDPLQLMLFALAVLMSSRDKGSMAMVMAAGHIYGGIARAFTQTQPGPEAMQ